MKTPKIGKDYDALRTGAAPSPLQLTTAMWRGIQDGSIFEIQLFKKNLEALATNKLEQYLNQSKPLGSQLSLYQ